jgi:hypothetical protein
MAQQAGTTVWSGVAADAFAESVHAIPIDLRELVDAHQRAMRALTDYGATLRNLQCQAAQILAEAMSSQGNVESASSRLSQAQSQYGEANGQYWLTRGEVEVLEGAKAAAVLVGDQAASSRLVHEISAAVHARNAAWSNRAAADAEIQSAQSALNVSRQQVAEAQSAARRIAIEREGAAQTLAGLMTSASEFVVGRRSWMDRVRTDVNAVSRFNWKHAAEGAIGAASVTLMRGAAKVDAFARAHAEQIRNDANIVNRYATDVSNLANSVAPAFTTVALVVDTVSLALPPPADAAGLLVAKNIAAVPSEVSGAADAVQVASAAVALGADELANVPAAQRASQFETDKKALESSSVSLAFDGVGVLTAGLPGIDEVPTTLAAGGLTNTVRAVGGPVVQNYVTPHLESYAQSKVGQQ